MVTVRFQEKPAFRVIGIKTWIPGTDNAAFGRFWQQCHADGTVAGIRKYCKDAQVSQTRSTILGLSCTEKDPTVRSFDFFVAVETDEDQDQGRYEVRTVPSHRWAIFSNEGSDLEALMACEMYAWMEWLPGNGIYVHDLGPELEVYFQRGIIEYWIPIREEGLF
jgi:predicted transcriptional regulator YdeE